MEVPKIWQSVELHFKLRGCVIHLTHPPSVFAAEYWCSLTVTPTALWLCFEDLTQNNNNNSNNNNEFKGNNNNSYCLTFFFWYEIVNCLHTHLLMDSLCVTLVVEVLQPVEEDIFLIGHVFVCPSEPFLSSSFRLSRQYTTVERKMRSTTISYSYAPRNTLVKKNWSYMSWR